MRAKRARVVCVAVALLWAAGWGCPRVAAAPGLLGEPKAWQAQPAWLPNPAATARVEAQAEGGLRFAVPEAGRGMKWLHSLKQVWIGEQPWLTLHYRASGLRPAADYFIWLYAREGVNVIRLDQVKADGAWHTLAVDASALLGDATPTEMALQVQAGPAGAWVEVAWVRFLETPPPDAEVIGGAPAAGQDWVLAEHARGDWQPQPTWLANPAQHHGHERRGDVGIFTVGDAGRGMKWTLYFDEPVQPSRYRYLSLRIRGQGTSIVGDYSICVLGDAAPDGQDATVLASPALAVTDGRWRTVDLPLAPARQHPRLVGIAVQAQAWIGSATLEIADLRFTTARRPRRLEDDLSVRPGWPAGAERVARAVNIGAAQSTLLPPSWGRDGVGGDDRSSAMLTPTSILPHQGGGGQGQQPHAGVLTAEEAQARFGLADWFPQEAVLVDNVPFQVRLDGEAVAASTGADESAVGVPVPAGVRASEVYLLVLTRLTGPEEAVRGGGQLMRIADSDRLRVILRYADGEARAALPAQVPPPGFGVMEGAQVVCVRADPERELRQVTLYCGTPQARLGIAAITLNTTRHRRYEALWRVAAVPSVAAPSRALPDLPPTARLDGHLLVLSNRYLEARFDAAHGLALRRLLHRALGSECLRGNESPSLFGLRIGKRDLGAQDCGLAAAEPLSGQGREGYRFIYRSPAPEMEMTVTLAVGDEPRLECEISLRNAAAEPLTVEPIGPRLPALAVGRAADMWYLIPASATLLHSRQTDYEAWYSGADMSLQFLDTYSPGLGGGIALMVRDLQSLEKRYHLAKSASGVAMSLDYQQCTLAPGETYPLAPAEIRLHTGDWHAALDAYRAWAAMWYAPAAERPRWWREVFNFRQRFLYGFDPLADPVTRAYRMDPALDADERAFGGVDYLHLFDWGNEGPYGRIYSRTGDYDAGDYLSGGWTGFRAAVDGARRRGIPVGFYIEGYLLDERGKLGQEHGRAWQMVGRDGTPLRWPRSTELYTCPAAKPWQEVQASTYAHIVERMDADGMYLDEFGFAGPDKWCWSPDHGHRVPSSSLQTEQALTRRVREAMSGVKPGAVLYTEDTPTDVNSQYQEGSFCYSMQRHRWSGSIAPLKLFRYAFPGFKNIEILNCDSPMASWATGVGWIFWNGEAIWLEGVADDWFAPQTRRAIRDCYRVLRAHRDAFAGDRAEPLVPTLADGLYANRFSGTSETAYTLYNARHETYSGDVLAVPRRPGARYFDAFAGRELQPRAAGGQDILSLAVPPGGVGCIVVR